MTAPENLNMLDAQMPQERIGVDGLLLILRRQALVIALVIVAVVGATAYYLQTIENRYSTRATIVLTPSETRIDRTVGQLESFNVSRTIVETELDMLRSRDFAAEVADWLALSTHPVFGAGPDAPGVSDMERDAAIIDQLLASYSVFRSGESLAIQIVAETPDPELTASIANSVAQTYIDRSARNQREEILQSISFLETRAAAMSDDLARLEMELAGFVRVNGLDDEGRLQRLLDEQMRLTRIIEVLGAGGRQEAELAQARESLAAIEERLREHTSAALTLERIERAMDLQQNRYQSAVERLNDLEMQLDFVPASARHVTIARVPVEPVRPNTRVALALSFVAATMLAFVIALLLESFSRRVWSEADVHRITGLGNLGAVPRIPRRGLLRRRPPPLDLLSMDVRSVFSEGFRGILTLWLRSRRASSTQVLMISSGMPDEGKSTVALSLAGSAASDGLRVLLVDLDVHRQGVMAQAGGEHETQSLEDMVEGLERVEQADAIGDALPSTTETSSPAAPKPGKLAERLDLLRVDGRERLNLQVLERAKKTLLPELRKHYDLIVLDTPPALVVDDACRFGSLADAVVIVVRWGRTKSDDLRETHQRLARSGSFVIGTIINGVDPQRKSGYRTGAYIGGAAYAKYRRGDA